MNTLRPGQPGWKSQWRLNLEAQSALAALQPAHRRRTVLAPVEKEKLLEEAIAAADKAEMSRQLRWQHRQIALGNCRMCGRLREPSSKSLCVRCLKNASDRAAAKVASQQQVPQFTE